MGLKKATRKAGKADGQAPSIEFEKVYRDRITGFEGKCTGFVSYVSGSSYIVTGNKRERMAQYGNAVTPPAMTWLVSRVLPILDEVA